MSLQRCTEWRSVLGAIVEVRLGMSVYRVGLVDDVMPDASGIWLAADGFHSRKFIEKSQGYSLWTSLVYYQPGQPSSPARVVQASMSPKTNSRQRN